MKPKQSAAATAAAGSLRTPRTWANLVTLLRTLSAVVLGGVAVVTARLDLLAAAYAIYWLGDMLDGFVARAFDQETRLGAVFDIVSDRACTSILCGGLIGMRPELGWSLIPFFLMFMTLDTMLSLAFLCWPIVSPNYFFCVDKAVYRANWSPLAKATNTAAVVAFALLGLQAVAVALVLTLVAIKLWSSRRVLRLLADAATAAARSTGQ